jgi:pimeloyl-ACP methyl ester carboxylesterase
MISNERPSFISWDGTRISYKILGNTKSDKTVVFINGLFCTESYWVFLFRELAPDYKIVSFDLRGHQYSSLPADPGNVTIESCAMDVEALLNEIGARQAVIAGFSLGVQILFEFYRLFPERCKGLMAITGPYENPLGTFYGLPIPDVVWETLLEFFSETIPVVTNTLWHALFHLPIVHGAATLMGSTSAEQKLMQGFYDHQKIVDVPNGLRMAVSAIKHSAREVLPRITVPTLVIGGEKDTFTPVKLSYTMRDEIPDVEFLLVKKGSHTTLLEQPEIVNGTVKYFLRRKVFTDIETKPIVRKKPAVKKTTKAAKAKTTKKSTSPAKKKPTKKS